ADNHPPMLEKDMYDSWKSRMKLYMLNRTHDRMILESVEQEKDMYDSWKSRMELYMLNRTYGRMILESIEQGPLIWPSMEVEGVKRLKKYSELSAAEAIQADCDVKATNIILQGLPPKVYALVSTHKVAKELWERIQMLTQGTSLTKQPLYQQSQFQPQATSYQSSPYGPTYHNSQFVSSGPSSLTHSISYPGTDTSSLVNHNAYMTSSSAPQIAYAQLDQQSSKHSPPEAGLVVPVFQKGDDPIDAINHMMSFLTSVMLMQGTSLTKQERECKLYDSFDKFAYQKGETLRDFYLRFSLLLNDMNMYNMKLEQFQVNIKFLNTLPSEWSKFVTDVKLVTYLHTTNVDQLHAYLVTDTLSIVNHNAYMASSSAPQIDYAPIVQQSSKYSPPEAGLVVPIFQKGDDPIDAINHMMSFLTAVITSRGDRILFRLVRLDRLHQDQEEHHANKGSLYVTTAKARVTCLSSTQNTGGSAMQNECDEINSAKIALMVNLSHYGSDNLVEALGFQNPCYLKKAQQLKPNLYDGSVIRKSDVVVVPDSEDTLMLAEESRSKMIEKQNDP
nr:hypothetical protein [Tanacetum cinerariifolium]